MKILNLIERRCLAPLKRDDVVRVSDTRSFTNHHSYKKLPQLPLLKLSVLKLDGSVFEIHVGRTATIAELKQAVEEFFGLLEGKIPWSLVWGHFCLCYVGQKLTNEKAYIRNFGIKDGDQLQFIRHMSISNSPLKRRSKSESVPYKQHSTLTYGSNGHEDEEKSGLDGSDNNAVHEDNSNEDLEEGPVPQFKVVHYLSGWLSCSKVMVGLKKGIRRQGPSIEIQAIRKLI
ncbi:unnamed protein product [Prunus armeniaca]|uniref:SNRNP25 ubiquitin-like domain-containing protein n=1 Tax=Prunus armeniaca TaxID=36596 RepID=A0A6J5U9B6_PRUAR|nr:hypothetical protein GBA52_009961 [Prunus armeniaca]CAB4272839.1 unnamed protein product [Prunus armeniaca]CAB4303365.1 unnamed protein product [Prunus armeniaca]